MGWRDLLQTEDERLVLPWVGGRRVRTAGRAFSLEGKPPAEHGWYDFVVEGRRLRVTAEALPAPDVLRDVEEGYLVGDRFVPDDVRIGHDLSALLRRCASIHLVEPGLDRFSRVSAGRVESGGPWIFHGYAFPVGPEDQVLDAWLDGAETVDHVSGVAPALDAAFRIERWRQAEARRRREEAEALRRAREEERARMARRQYLREHLGDAVGRRAVARFDFEEAAAAALAVGGAELLDVRPAYKRGEMVIRFRYARQRFECTCDQVTLRVIDAGICLIDHESGVRGDDRFTLESLPGVIAQAQREGVLVVFRHVD